VRRGAIRALGAVAGVFIAAAAPAARAQSVHEVAVEMDKSPAADLYVKRRPPAPESPRLPRVLEERLAYVEGRADLKREEAIRLLRQFLASKPTGQGRAEGLFKLAELLWEDGRRKYIARMDVYERRVEGCRQRRTGCGKLPREPELDLTESETLYKAILEQHPDYPRRDLVLYLVGFAARQDGRTEEALGYFQRVIAEHARSPLYADAWMMIGENQFVLAHWQEARAAYAHVLERPTAAAYDLALFKSAWCDWKLGEMERAARRFKLVLDLAAEAERTGTERERRRRSQLRDEALEYLVVVFSEDENIAPRDVYQFLASIGGERYSETVLVRLADLFFNQAAYERAIATHRFLIEVDPMRVEAARHQRRIVDAHLAALDSAKAVAEIKVLAESYGPGSAWVKANRADHPREVGRTVDSIEQMVRQVAKGFHAEAQAREKGRGRPDPALYQRAADTYAYYLSRFGRHRRATEVRFLRAEILLFKLGKFEEAGDEYLAVGKSTPVGKYHKDALYKAMDAYKKARPPGASTAGRRELLPVDRKFAEAIDLYATLFPADKDIVGVIYENGELFYRYGDYDEAIKRFGLIVTRYPDDPNAGAAGDRILEGLNKAEDYENIENWARKLKKARAFQSREQQARLDRLIVESILKSGEKYGATDPVKASRFYLRVPAEFPGHPLAPKALFNAGVMLEKARRPEEAAQQYLVLADRYRQSEMAGRAAFTAAQVLESVAHFDRAADAYELVATRHPNGPNGADARFNAGVLRQALAQPKRAIEHYQVYATRYRKTKRDTEEVAFRVAVVREEAGDFARAERDYGEYLKRYPGGDHALEALMRAGRCAFRQGQLGRAERRFEDVVKRFKRARGPERRTGVAAAAEARYYEGELIYRKYDRISLDVRPRSLGRTLKAKMKLLDQASVVYLDVVDYRDPQWATAALYRIGAVMEEFARSLREAPTPSGLSSSEQKLYREQLDNEVINIEEKAIELYAVGYQKALALKVYGEYTRKLREALGRMAASRFPPNKEVREGLRVGGAVPQPVLVKEVVRDRK
jgi:cellulose synthase operon protein C